MLNKSLADQLRKLNGVADKVVFKYPTTVMVSEEGGMICNLRVNQLDPDQFDEFAIYEMSQLLNTLALFDNYEVIMGKDVITVKSGQNTALYKKSDAFLLEEYNKPVSIIETTKGFDTVASFELSAADINQFKKATGIFKDLDALRFKSQDTNLTVMLSTNSRFEISSNTYSKEFLGASSKNFDFAILKDNFIKLPSTDYNVEIKYNQSKDAYRVLFLTDTFDIMITVLS